MYLFKSLEKDLDIRLACGLKSYVIRLKPIIAYDKTIGLCSYLNDRIRVNYLLVVVDMTIVFFNDRFDQLKIFENIFGFLFVSKRLKLLDDNELKD